MKSNTDLAAQLVQNSSSLVANADIIKNIIYEIPRETEQALLSLEVESTGLMLLGFNPAILFPAVMTRMIIKS